MPDTDGARALGPRRPKNLLRHLPILEYHCLAFIGHAEEPTRLPFWRRAPGQLAGTIGKKMMSILGPNQCAGSLPELGVIFNDRQWVISELPQLGQTLPQVRQVRGVGRARPAGQIGAVPESLGSWWVLPSAGNRPPSALAFPGYLPES